MPAVATEILPVVGARSGPQPLLVPALCGVAIVGSWLALCLAIIPWAQ